MNIGRHFNLGQFGILIGLILIVVIFTALEPSYLSAANILTVLEQASVTAILTIGVTFIIITSGIDLSFGSILGFSAVIAGSLVLSGAGLIVAFVAALGVGLLCGLVNGLIITQLGVTPLIATLGSMSLISGFALILTGGRTLFGLPEAFVTTFGGDIAGVPIVVWVLVVVLFVSGFLLNRTKFGQYCIALGGSPETVRMAGINVAAYTTAAYAFSGLLAGLCGILTAGRLNSADPQVGADLLLPVIAAAILGGARLSGGRGSVIGAALGAIFISALQAGLTTLLIPAFYQRLAVGAAIILAVAFQTYRDGGWTFLAPRHRGRR